MIIDEKMFITLEGPEGAGKTTQAKMIGDYLEEKGQDVVLTREPGGTRIGREIRQVLLHPENIELQPLTELLLYGADRAQHVNEMIRPALLAGKTVICDRYTHSTVAYQCFGRGLSRQLIDEINKLATTDLRPDLTIVLDLPVQVGLDRAAKRNEYDRMEQEKLDFHEKVRQGFLAMAKEDEKIKVVDAAKSPEAIFSEIKKFLKYDQMSSHV